MKGLCVLCHLGLGDHLILNGLYRHFAGQRELLCIPVKYHNCPSVEFMLRDLPNVVVRPVEDDEDALFFVNNVWQGEKLKLGCFDHRFDGRAWDKSFYSQAGLSFQLRWDGWKCERDQKSEIGTNDDRPYRFVHDDPARGFRIVQQIPIHTEDDLLTVRPHQTSHIFQWWNMIVHAREIHCIPSSFAHWIDSIDLPDNPKLFLHSYTRAGEPLAVFRHDWEILK